MPSPQTAKPKTAKPKTAKPTSAKPASAAPPAPASGSSGETSPILEPSLTRRSSPILGSAERGNALRGNGAPKPANHAVPCPAPLPAGSLLSSASLSLDEVGGILALARELENEDPDQRALRLARRCVALLFYESSTRTRTSFELAAKSLGAMTTLVSDKSSSIEKGESLKDTGLTLRALGAECIILRHTSSGAPYLLAHATGLPVLNAGDGMHEHPSQALLDLRTILLHLRDTSAAINEHTLDGVTIAITGDILHSRVARSNALLLPRLGAKLILCGPPQLLPEDAAALAPGVSIERDFEKALAQADAVMMLRIQKERLAGLNIDLAAYIGKYQLDAARLAAHAPKAMVMHPGPMIRGLEIASDVADGPQSVIEEQVRHGVSIRMALLARALAPKTEKTGGRA